MAIGATVYVWPLPGVKPKPTTFPGGCGNNQATVADGLAAKQL